jgi:hypothetical protein
MATVSSRTGQAALQSLPSKSSTSKRSIQNYALPDSLIHDRSSLGEGLTVLKVCKVCLDGFAVPSFFFAPLICNENNRMICLISTGSQTSYVRHNTLSDRMEDYRPEESPLLPIDETSWLLRVV